MCRKSPVTWTSTLVGTSTWPARSFCLCCFWPAVRHLWSQHMSGISHHTGLHPGSNIYLTSWFILSVLIFTFSETSVVPTHVQNPPSHGLHPGRNVYLTNWVILSVFFFDRLWNICSQYMCLGSPITRTSTLVET